MENETEMWDTPDPVKVLALEQAVECVVELNIVDPNTIVYYAEKFEQFLRKQQQS